MATLEVVIPPQISDKHSTEDLSVAEGGSAKFICSATGHPHPTIIWQKMPKSQKDRAKIRFHDKKGKEVHQKRVHGEVLELQKVSREDMGTYLCIAKNNVPPAVSKNFKLTVNCEYILWQHGSWSFQTVGTKLEIFLPKNHYEN